MSLNYFFSAAGFNWYGFLIGTGMVVCIIIAYFMAKKKGFYGDLVFDIAIITIPCAIVGARLYYVIFDAIAGGQWDFLKIIGFGEDGLSGLAIYGGLIGAVLGGFVVAALQKRKKPEVRVTFLHMADLAFTVIILGQVIGRWGNFANGEAYGNPVTNPSWQWFPYAVQVGGEWFQATFFYESLWNAIGFCFLMWFYNGKRRSFDGFIISCYCIFYGFGRFFIEGLRSDSLWLIPDIIRVSQVVSVLIFLFGLGFILYHVYKARTLNKKILIMVPEELVGEDYYGYINTPLYKKRWRDRLAAEAAAQAEADAQAEAEAQAEGAGIKATAENALSGQDAEINSGLNADNNVLTDAVAENETKKIKKKKEKVDYDADLFDGYNGEEYKDDLYEDAADIEKEVLDSKEK